MESRDHAFMIAGQLVELCKDLGLGLVYKSSFDKANRTRCRPSAASASKRQWKSSPTSRRSSAVPVLTDIHTEEQCAAVAPTVDVLQIPPSSAAKTDLLVAAAKTGRAINVKKGQFLHLGT